MSKNSHDLDVIFTSANSLGFELHKKVKAFNPPELGFHLGTVEHIYRKDREYLFYDPDTNTWSLDGFSSNGKAMPIFQNCTIKSHDFGVELLKSFGVIK